MLMHTRLMVYGFRRDDFLSPAWARRQDSEPRECPSLPTSAAGWAGVSPKSDRGPKTRFVTRRGDYPLLCLSLAAHRTGVAAHVAPGRPATAAHPYLYRARPTTCH